MNTYAKNHILRLQDNDRRKRDYIEAGINLFLEDDSRSIQERKRSARGYILRCNLKNNAARISSLTRENTFLLAVCATLFVVVAVIL